MLRSSSRAMSPTPYGCPLSPSTTSNYSSSLRNEDFGEDGPVVILTRTELRKSIEDYEYLLQAAKVYRTQMMLLAQSSANFGYALERVSKSKGAIEAGPGLQASAGVHLLISNHQQILSDILYKTFEIPLLENLDRHKTAIFQSEENYDKALHEMSAQIKATEAENMNNGRNRQRDLSQFRQALQELTRQVDELDRIKNDYYKHMLDTEQKNFNLILSKATAVVKAEIEIYERVASKGMSDPSLEQMLNQSPDPFGTYPTVDESGEIFTVLPQTSLVSMPVSSHQSPGTTTPLSPDPTQPDMIADLYNFTNTQVFMRDPFLRAEDRTVISPEVESTPLRRKKTEEFLKALQSAHNSVRISGNVISDQVIQEVPDAGEQDEEETRGRQLRPTSTATSARASRVNLKLPLVISDEESDELGHQSSLSSDDGRVKSGEWNRPEIQGKEPIDVGGDLHNLAA